MKVSIAAAFACFLLSFFVQAQTSTNTGAIVKFNETSHDFGDVTEGSIVKYTFAYKNIGTDTLRIDHIATSCGCTVPSSYEHVVAPGKSSSIDVEFNSVGKSGITNKTLTILSNAVSEQPAILLSIRANVVPKK